MKVLTLIGIMIMAAIVGIFSALVTHLDANRERKQSHMRQIDSFMKSHAIESSLRADIHDFYDYTWRNDSAAHIDQLFANLPPSLKVQLKMALKKEMMFENEFFSRLCDDNAAIAMARRLKSRVAIPNEIIISTGNPADCVFFVQSGRLEEFEEVAGILGVYQVLETGAMFGLNAYFIPNRAHDARNYTDYFRQDLFSEDSVRTTSVYKLDCNSNRN